MGLPVACGFAPEGTFGFRVLSHALGRKRVGGRVELTFRDVSGAFGKNTRLNGAWFVCGFRHLTNTARGTRPWSASRGSSPSWRAPGRTATWCTRASCKARNSCRTFCPSHGEPPKIWSTPLKPPPLFDAKPNQHTHLNSKWRVLIFRVQLMSLEYNRQVSSRMSFGSQGTRFPSRGENVTEST